MRILLVTREDPYETPTGVATYVRDLATILVRVGHEVVHLYVETRPCLKPHLRWVTRRGIQIVIVAVPLFVSQSWEDRLEADVTSPAVEKVVERALARIRPDILHLHDLSGIPSTLVLTAKRQGYPIIITLHDFWPFCRQFLLIRPGLVPCGGSEGGRACSLHCSEGTPIARRLLDWADAGLPPRAQQHLRRGLRFYRRMRGRRGSQFALREPRAPHRPDERLAEAFARREALMLESVLAADRILTVSEFAKAMYLRHGYPEDRIDVLGLSLLSIQQVRWRQRSFQGFPVRFGYLGRVTPWKGAHLLAEAVRDVPAHLARFTFYGSVDDEDKEFLVALSGDHSGMHFAGRYARNELERILDEIDVAIFPSVMSETLGLVGIEMQAAGLPIIGADHAAIAEYVLPNRNGLLFPPGDVSMLRSHILRFIHEPALIGRLSAQTVSPPPMEAHASKIVRVYADAVQASRRRDAMLVPAISLSGSDEPPWTGF